MGICEYNEDKVFMVKVLFVEDDEIDQIAFKRFVSKRNLDYNYSIASSVFEARRILETEKFDIVLLDYQLGDGTAAELFRLLKGTPFIIISGLASDKNIAEAKTGGAHTYLMKDINRNYLENMIVSIQKAIENND